MFSQCRDDACGGCDEEHFPSVQDGATAQAAPKPVFKPIIRPSQKQTAAVRRQKALEDATRDERWFNKHCLETAGESNCVRDEPNTHCADTLLTQDDKVLKPVEDTQRNDCQTSITGCTMDGPIRSDGKIKWNAEQVKTFIEALCEHVIVDEKIETTVDAIVGKMKSPIEKTSVEAILGPRIADVLGLDRGLNLFEMTPPGTSINAVEGTCWVKIGVAVDSGACSHVTPQNIFALMSTPSTSSMAGKDFYGADEGVIKNLGEQLVKGEDDNGNNISLKFDVADKLTRPLASVHEIVECGNRVTFEKGKGYIQNIASGVKTPLRCEGKLFFLDMWVEVPRSLSSSPFVRPS